MNGNISHKEDLLDRALAGHTPETKARVLDLVLKLGVSPEDEFWLIFLAIGHLQALVESSPNTWQSLFEDFQQELSQWTDTNIQTLDLLASKAQAMKDLSHNANELTSILSTLVNTCSTLMQRLASSDATLNKSLNNWQRSTNSWTTNQESIQREIRILHQEWQQARNTITSQNTTGTSPANPWPARLALLGGIALATLTVFSWQTYQTMNDSSQRIEWLLQKQNRRDCKDGLLPPGSPLCN